MHRKTFSLHIPFYNLSAVSNQIFCTRISIIFLFILRGNQFLYAFLQRLFSIDFSTCINCQLVLSKASRPKPCPLMLQYQCVIRPLMKLAPMLAKHWNTLLKEHGLHTQVTDSNTSQYKKLDNEILKSLKPFSFTSRSVSPYLLVSPAPVCVLQFNDLTFYLRRSN